MMYRLAGTLLAAALAVATAGCSVLLDPENCSSDEDCNGGVCQDGVCLGGGDPADMAEPEPDNRIQPPDMSADLAVDAAPDLSPPDAEIDMAPDMAPPDPLPPSCVLAAVPDDMAPTTALEVTLTAQISDPDSALDALEATLDGEPITLDGEPMVRPLEEGANRFVLRAVDPDGLSCETAVTVVRDTTAPTFQALTPPAGADLLTSNAAFPISGRVIDAHFDPAGAGALEVTVDGDPVEPEITWDAAAFSFDVTLEEGRSEIALTAVDDLGNRSETATIAVRLDATPPVVLVDAPVAAAQVFADRVEVRGRVQDDRQPVPGANYTIEVAAAGQAPVRIDGLADDQGAFSRRVPLTLGQNTLTVTGRDMAGNAGQVVRQVTRLRAEPCVTITAPAEGAFTRVARLDVSGDVCPAVERVELSIAGGAPVEVVPRNNRFQGEVLLPAAGSHVITATAFAGDGDAADAVRVVFDDSPPTLVISEPVEGQCVGDRDLQVCGRVGDLESGVQSVSLLVLDEEVMVPVLPEGGPFCQVVRVREGAAVQVVAEARNGAGGVTSRTVNVRVDLNEPTVCITRNGQCLQGAQRPWFGVDAGGRVNFTGRAVWDICGVATLTVDGIPVNVVPDGTFSIARPFTDGDQDITLFVRDTAGNESPPIAFVFRVDGTRPVLDDISPAQTFFTTEAQVRLEVEMSDAGSGLTSISIGGQEVFRAAAGVNQGSGREIAARVVPLVEGLNTFEVVAVDLVGNRRVETVTVRRDTRPPVLTVTSPEPGRPAPVPTVVVGTVDDGAEGSGAASVTVNGVEATIDADSGTWRAEGVPIDPAEPSISVTAIDDLGNLVDPPIVQPVTVSEFGTHDPAIDGLVFEGAIGWLGPIDVDLDGLLDLVVLGATPDVTSQVFRQIGPGRFVAQGAADVGLPEGMTVRAAAVADLDENGTHDLVIVGVNRTVVALGTGGGGFALVDNPRIPGSAAPTGMALGLTTLNGSLDLVVMAGGATRFYFGDGTGAFDREPIDTQGLTGLSTHAAVQLVDVDGDDVLDVLAVGPNGSTLWLGAPFGAFQPIAPGSGFVSAGASTALAFDADRDGVLDLLTVGAGAGRFMLGDGARGFVEDDGGILAWPDDITALERLDYDGDTRDDLVAAGGTLRLWHNTADGFEPVDVIAAGADPGGPAEHVAVTDLDGDGDDDLIVGGPAGLRFIRSNRVATDPDYGFVSLEILRSQPPAIQDGWGARVEVDLVEGDDGEPERALLARPIGPTIVSIGPLPAVDVAVHYVDRGEVGGNVRDRPGLLARVFTEVFARE